MEKYKRKFLEYVLKMLESGTVKQWVFYFFELGATLALVISWYLNQSVPLAVVHGVGGWLYVIYYLIYLAGS